MIRPGMLVTASRPFSAGALRSYATQQAAKTVTVTSTKSNESSSLLGNLAASYDHLSAEEKYAVEEKIVEASKGDWKLMSPTEQHAAFHLNYGPIYSRSNKLGKNHGAKTWGWTLAASAFASLVFLSYRQLSPPPVPSMSKEWQEASTEYMQSQKLNPISGVSSEGYKGTGMVQ